MITKTIFKTFIQLLLVGFSSASFAQLPAIDEFFYPAEAIENKIQGKIFVRFSALQSGEIIDSTVQTVQGLGYGLDKIAIEAVRKAPPLPRNYVTRLRKDTLSEYILPILFTIRSKDWGNYYYTKGFQEQSADKHVQAIRQFLLAIGFVEKKSLYYFALYQSYYKLGNKEEACKYLKKAKKWDSVYKQEWIEQCK